MPNKPAMTFEDGKIKVYGNGHSIPIIYGFELSDKEKKEFDYIEDIEENFTGFRYKGNLYNLGDIMNVHNTVHNPNPPAWLKNFDGYTNDSFFSGILVKFTDDNEFVKVYTFIS